MKCAAWGAVIAVSALLLLGVWAGCSSDKPTKFVSSGTVTGKVYDAGTMNSISDAWIFYAIGKETSSGADGSYTLHSIPVGERSIRASAMNYETKICTLNVHAGTNSLRINMTPASQ